jgi:hypothetical protein
VPFCPQQTPLACPDVKPDHHGGKPVTNRLNYGMVLVIVLSI